MEKQPESGDRESERWLTPGVAGIGSASLLADLGHEIPTSLLPSFLSSTLGAPASALGLIEGVADGLAGVARLAGGPPADNPRSRRTIAAGGYTLTAIFSGAIAVATSVWHVGLLRAGAWVSRGYRVPSRNALLADAVTPQAYGRAYGFERAMDNLGAILGPLIAAVLVAVVGVRWAIGVSVLPGLLAVGAIVYAIRRVRSSAPKRPPALSANGLPTPDPEPRTGHGPQAAQGPTRTAAESEGTSRRSQIRRLFGPGIRRLFTGISAFEFGNCAATLLILRATELLSPTLGADRATTTTLLLYTAYNATASLTSVLAGHYSDRRGPVNAMTIGAAAFLLAYGALGLGTASWMLLTPFFVCAGVGIGFVETGEHAAVALWVPEELRGSGFGLLAGVQSLGNLVASSLAGILWATAGPGWAFGYLAACMAVASVVLGLHARSDRGKPDSREMVIG